MVLFLGSQPTFLYFCLMYYAGGEVVLPGYGRTSRRVLAALSDGRPWSRKDLVKALSISDRAIEGALYRLLAS